MVVLLAAAALFVWWGSSIGPASSSAPSPAPPVPLGDYAGPDNPAGVAHFASVTGARVTLATDYLDGSSGWTGMDSTAGLVRWSSSPYQLVLSVPILPSHASATLARGAGGAYDPYFVTLARNLVDAGESHAYLRLGWEFNGTWYRWSVRSARGATEFAAYFRHMVDAMRSVQGQAFKFVWNPNGDGSSDYTPAQAYPGKAYVDFIGSDVYANCWCHPFDAQNAWAHQLSQPWGLDWLASFAAQTGKPIVFPEWGVDYRSDGHGLGDDAYFVGQFATWIASHGVAWTDIFAYNGAHQDDITDGRFPDALAVFEARFG